MNLDDFTPTATLTTCVPKTRDYTGWAKLSDTTLRFCL